jgi:hypothetical protein
VALANCAICPRFGNSSQGVLALRWSPYTGPALALRWRRGPAPLALLEACRALGLQGHVQDTAAAEPALRMALKRF